MENRFRETRLPSEYSGTPNGGQNWYPPAFGGGTQNSSSAMGALGAISGQMQGTPRMGLTNQSSSPITGPQQEMGGGASQSQLSSGGFGGLEMFYDPQMYAQWAAETDPTRKSALWQALQFSAQQKQMASQLQRIANARGEGPGGTSTGGQYGQDPLQAAWNKQRYERLARLPYTSNPVQQGGQR